MKVLNARLVRLARRANFIWSFARPFVRPGAAEPIRSPNTILVFDLHLIGDLVLLLPLLRSIRAKHPQARISLVAGPWADSIIAAENLIDEHIPYAAPWVKSQAVGHALRAGIDLIKRLRSTAWDWAIDVRGDVRHILIAALSGASRRIGYAFTGGERLLTDVIDDDGRLQHVADHHRRIAVHLESWDEREEYTPRLHLSPHEQERAAKIGPFVGFHFGASIVLRRLPISEAARLVNLFEETDEELVLFDPPDLTDYNDELILLVNENVRRRLVRWRGTLRDFIVTISRAKVLYAVDSGPAHVAAALGVRTVVFFGPNRPEYVGPIGSTVTYVEKKDVPCRPCQNFCTHVTHQFCMRGIVGRHLKMPALSTDTVSLCGTRDTCGTPSGESP